MNVRKMREVIEYIRERTMEGSHLDMDRWYNGKGDVCDTAACMAGWTCLQARKCGPENLLADHPHPSGVSPSYWSKASEILGLTDSEAKRLFYQWNWDPSPKSEYHCAAVANNERGKVEALSKQVEMMIEEYENKQIGGEG